MIQKELLNFDHVPGERFLMKRLQSNLVLMLSNEVIKAGKLLLFRRVHYHLQLTFAGERKHRDICDIPLPFGIETYEEDNVMYFDYRIRSLHSPTAKSLPLPSVNENEPRFLGAILEFRTL